MFAKKKAGTAPGSGPKVANNRKEMRGTKPRAQLSGSDAAKDIPQRLHDAALTYVERGWTLVPVRDKRPMGDAWNTRTAMRTAGDVHMRLGARTKANGVGVLLGESGLCSFDPDDLQSTRKGLAKLGIDVDDVLDSGWRIESGKPNSARALFALPKGDALGWKRLRIRKPRNQWKVGKDGELHPSYAIVFELRAQSYNLQDVLPPSAHPSGSVYSAQPLPKRMPVLAGPLLALWYRWQANPKEAEAELFDAFGVPKEDRAPSLTGEPGKLDYPSGARMDYNAATSVEELLERHGYEQHDGGRWAHPGATGSPGCRAIPGKDDLWRSDNGGDPLHGTFDAWAAHVVLDHNGDQQAAEAAWYAEHPKGSEFAPIEDDDGDEEDDVLQGLPELPDAALYGVLGAVVDAATRNSEATRVGVAVSVLAEFAVRYGGALRLRIGDDDRTVPLFALMVGPTGKGRKGTSSAFPKRLFAEVDRCARAWSWQDEHGNCSGLPGTPQVVTGVSSGQGLIDLVRDEGVTYTQAGQERQMPGAADKRLLVDLSEFATVLVQSSNEGNILSQVLRDAFDGKPLASPARTNQLRSTGAHICMLGHVTMHEFRKQTVENKRNTDISNGLLNRFCIVYSARNKLVANPKPVPDDIRRALAQRIAFSVHEVFADVGNVGPNDRRLVEFRLDRRAQVLWDSVYKTISNQRYDSEVVAALMSRREALARMLAVLLAALNGECRVSRAALLAALAWSEYMVASTSRVFASIEQRRKAKQLRADIESIVEWAKTREGFAFSARELAQRWHKRLDDKRRNAALQAMLEAAPPQLVKDGGTYRLRID